MRAKLGLLYSIGTPLAAEHLVSYFWTNEGQVGRWAAAYFIAMLSNVGVSAALEAMGRLPHEREASWVWQPFATAEASSLAAVVNRAAHVVLTDPSDLPEVTLDSRVAVALLVHLRRQEALSSLALSESLTVERIQQLRTRLTGSPAARHDIHKYSLFVDLLQELEKASDIAAVDEVLDVLLVKQRRLYALLHRVTPELRGVLAARLLRYPYPEIEDWRNVRKPLDYHFNRGIHLGSVLLLTLAALTTGALGLYAAGHAVAAGFAALALLAAGAVLLFRPDSREDDFLIGLTLLFVGPFVSLKETFAALRRRDGGAALGWLVAFALALALAGGVAGLLYSALSLVARHLTWINAGTTFGGLTAIALLLWYLGKRRSREARNPLRGLLRFDAA